MLKHSKTRGKVFSWEYRSPRNWRLWHTECWTVWRHRTWIYSFRYQTCQAVAGYGRHSQNSCSSRRTVCQQSAVARFYRAMLCIRGTSHGPVSVSVDFTEARDSEWQWHQLGYMQFCTLLQTDNHASNPPLSFFTGRMPFLPPNQQCQSSSCHWYLIVTYKEEIYCITRKKCQ